MLKSLNKKNYILFFKLNIMISNERKSRKRFSLRKINVENFLKNKSFMFCFLIFRCFCVNDLFENNFKRLSIRET